jgi:dephospho-CoA kinase
MKVIGLTGGIGSGKSRVANILKDKYGAFLLETDRIAKEQMEPGGVSYQEIIDYIGQEIVSEDRSIDRARLAGIIFEDKEKRLKINQITHPKVLAEVQEEILDMRKKGTIPYLIIETALMIEAQYDFICDEIWYVFAPEEVRRSRLKQDRSYSDEKIDSIFGNQSKEEAFRNAYSRVIENVGDIRLLEEQVDRLIHE